MHRTSVVLYNNVTRAPLMAVHSFGIGTPLIEKIEQRATFFLGHPFETGGYFFIGDEEGSPASFRMHAHRRMIRIGDLAVMPGAFRHLGAAIFTRFCRKKISCRRKGRRTPDTDCTTFYRHRSWGALLRRG